MLQWLLVASLLLAAQPALAQSMQGMSMGSPPAAGELCIHQGLPRCDGEDGPGYGDHLLG